MAKANNRLGLVIAVLDPDAHRPWVEEYLKKFPEKEALWCLPLHDEMFMRVYALAEKCSRVELITETFPEGHKMTRKVKKIQERFSNEIKIIHTCIP